MQDFLAIDDDCLELFDDIRENGSTYSYIIAPMDTIKKMLFWILGEDDDANPAVMMVDTDWDVKDDPYLLVYAPEMEFSLGPFGFSMNRFEGPVYIYDKLSSSCLADVDRDDVIPFHYEREDEEGWEVLEKIKAKKKEQEDKKKPENKATDKTPTSSLSAQCKTTHDDIDVDDDEMTGFSETFTDANGNCSSYSFYSTDRKLVEEMAGRVGKGHEIINYKGKK